MARCLHGEGTPAVALVTYGGRAYDNALAEMCELLTKNNFKPAAGGAFLCRHVFSDKLAAGRPDAADLSELRMLAQGAALKLRSEGEIKPPKVPGDAQAAYYTPLKTDKTPAKFLKAKPSTAAVLCESAVCAPSCARWVRSTRTTRLIFRVPVLNAVPARPTARPVQRNSMIRISCRTPLCSRNSGPNSVRRMQFFSKALL